MKFSKEAKEKNDSTLRFDEKLARFIFDRPFTKTPKPIKKVKSILVIRWDNKIGDSIVTSFFYREMKRHNQIKITVLWGQSNLDTLFGKKYIDNIIICKNRRNWFQFVKALMLVRRERFDAIVMMNDRITSRELIFLKCSGARKLLCADRSIKLGDNGKLRLPNADHYSKRAERALKYFEVSEFCSDYEVSPVQEEVDKVKNELPRDIRFLVVFNPFGYEPERQMSFARITEIVNMILKVLPASHIFINNPPDINDKIDILIKGFGNSRVISSKTLSFESVISLVAICDIVVTVDTATSHLAAALKKHSIVFHLLDMDHYALWNCNSGKSISIFTQLPKSKENRINVGEFDDANLIRALMKKKSLFRLP